MPELAIERAVEILKGGRLHRYNTLGDEVSETSLLEGEFAQWQGSQYCIACASGGQAMQIALRACGVKPGDEVLANAYTLAPVPGAIHAVGGVPVLVEIDRDWHMDVDDFLAKARSSQAKVLMLSHMRGHIADMDAICEICERHDISIIEDCAHTMGAKWKGARSGNFGRIACFSNQTYKHMNSGEGGFITTNDDELAARSIIMSGSYMLYERHGTVPPAAVMNRVRLDTPNLSARLDNLRAALLRAQLPGLESNIRRWNERYQILERELGKSPHLNLPKRAQFEAYVGSSIQFQVGGFAPEHIPDFIENCAVRGVELKWFGAEQPTGFTSRYDSWQYFKNLPDLPVTREVLSRTCDMRVPLTFSAQDCELIADIICDEAQAMVRKTR